MKLDQNGNKIWAVNASTVGAANSFAITVAGNELAVTGNFYQDMKWGTQVLAQGTNESADVFLARLNAQTGDLMGVDTLKSSYGAEEIPAAVIPDKRGNYYIGGKFYSNIIIGNNTLTNSGGETDWFVAKFGAANCSCTLPVAAFSNTNGSGNTVNFIYTGTTPVDSVVWDFGNGSRATGLTTSITFAQSGSYNVCATAYNSCGSHTYCKNVATNGVGITDPDAFFAG